MALTRASSICGALEESIHIVKDLGPLHLDGKVRFLTLGLVCICIRGGRYRDMGPVFDTPAEHDSCGIAVIGGAAVGRLLSGGSNEAEDIHESRRIKISTPEWLIAISYTGSICSVPLKLNLMAAAHNDVGLSM